LAADEGEGSFDKLRTTSETKEDQTAKKAKAEAEAEAEAEEETKGRAAAEQGAFLFSIHPWYPT
jgi:hypothetical protein